MPPKSVTGGGGSEKVVMQQGGGVPRVRGELDVSTEVLLEGPELVLKDPTSSLTGRALSGMLAAQLALQVSMPLVIIIVNVHHGSSQRFPTPEDNFSSIIIIILYP